MKHVKNSPRARGRRLLTVSLIGLLAASGVSGQTSDADVIRALQAEVAALRKQLANKDSSTTPVATTTTTTPATSSSAAPVVSQPASVATTSTTSDNEMLTLSPFEVKGDRDYGYLKTNAATATRVGMEIQKAPMAISVISEDFIKDTGLNSITDVLRYTSSGSPDGRFAMRVPGSSTTPQGNFTMRGFTVNSLLRNGIFRYTSFNLDNVDRVEIVKGPAAVFFGQGYPGGVINYITKKPDFAKTFTNLSYQIDDNGGDKVTLDTNIAHSNNAAFRLVSAWSDLGGDRTGEFKKNFNVTPSITLVPFDSGKLKINLEFEYLKETYNQNDYGWVNPQGWFDAYANPTPELIAASGVANAAAYRTRIFNNVNNWLADVRKATNDPTLPLYTQNSVKPYGYYRDLNGNLVEDKGFNFTNSGAYTDNEVKTFQATIDASPLSWMDARYTFTKDSNTFDNIGGLNLPNADYTYNANASGSGAGYYRNASNHQLDVILKADFLGMKNKLLIGGLYQKVRQQYMGSAGAVYYLVPGYNYPTAPVNNLPNPNGVNGLVLTNQVLRDRNGNILSAQDVYAKWDPAIHVNPPTSKLWFIERNILDEGRPVNDAYYANWQVSAFEDRLTGLIGYRKESQTGKGQFLNANPPWFSNPPDAYLYPDLYPPDVYGYSASYAGDPENFRKRSGDSGMIGVSYALTPEVTVYATVSQTFKINTGLAGGYDELALDQLLTDALANNPGGFDYRGTQVTSIATGRAALEANGAMQSIQNEDGMNYEFGVKTTLWDSKLVGTLSFFRGIRKDQKLDDTQKTLSDPLNYSTTLFAPTSLFYGSSKRNLRWRTVGVENQIEGTEFDIIYTPFRNYQIVFNGAWMWQAETTENPTIPKPGSTAFNAATAANQAYYTMYYNNRIENVPEYRLNTFHKYTFTNGLVRGLSLGAGARYSSETVVARDLNWNPDRGGFQAGNYVVYDANISYPWKVRNYKLSTSLSINNLTDKVYYEGNVAPADSRSFTLRTTVSF